jgi:hypothetical protein
MTTLGEFGSEVFGIVTNNPIRCFAIRCGDSELTVHRWNSETANAAEAKFHQHLSSVVSQARGFQEGHER